MRTSFIPSTDVGLLEFAQNFNARISEAAEAYGLSLEQAAILNAVVVDYAAKFDISNAPETRTRGAVAAKNDARTELKSILSSYGRMIGANLTVTHPQKISLGLTIRSRPTRTPVPSESPWIMVLGVDNLSAKIRLADRSSSINGGRPRSVSGAAVFSYIAPTHDNFPPVDVSEFKFEGNFGRTVIDLHFPSHLAPGTRVWIAACWFNGRKQSGPVCQPVGTNLPGGGVSFRAMGKMLRAA